MPSTENVPGSKLRDERFLESWPLTGTNGIISTAAARRRLFMARAALNAG
jgi:hypothetical protein